MIKGGHLLRPVGSHRAPLWVSLHCGGCGGEFTGNAHSVPQVHGWPACPSCWGRLNLFRRQANMPEWDTPEDAYPEG